MKNIFLFFFLIFSTSSSIIVPSQTPQKAFEQLIEGNKRYVNQISQNHQSTKELRESLITNQSPLAIIVGCSDSRVPPELIFDVTLGDLFVVRIAGNVVGPLEMESIEYAAEYLHSPLILILGHESCGAVEAVIQNKAKDFPTLTKFIESSVLKARDSHTDHLWETAIKMNIQNSKNIVLQSLVIQKLLQDKKIEVVSGYYNLKTGSVELLPEENSK
ncbi:MAG: carbonic anhydrase [Chlamydiota bacterium]